MPDTDPVQIPSEFRWRKLGRIFEPSANSWMATRAGLPIVHPEGPDTYRVFFTGRGQDGRSAIGWFRMSVKDKPQVVAIAPAASLGPGQDGMFDDSGSTGSWVLPAGDELLLFYIGWNQGVRVPFYNRIGLAASRDGGDTFYRKSRGPIIPVDDLDPIFTASPCVIKEGDVYRLWYLSCTRWERTEHTLQHHYDLHYAESKDLFTWKKRPAPVLTFASADEYAISRPCVLRTSTGYSMWFSYRGDHYRIGYAESPDGIAWTRKSHGGLDVSDAGWDSEMVEYPFVFQNDSNLYMLYNGNHYGETGIGIAVLDV
jgi:hypothetical protein